MLIATNAPESLLSVNATALFLKGRGLKPNTRYSVMSAIARGELTVAAQSQWGVLIRRADVERFADARTAGPGEGR